jgi:hypothetical protein
VVTQPHAFYQIPRKLSKSGLIGVWHKYNLYLGTNTIGNGNPYPVNIHSRTRSIRMISRSLLFFHKWFQFFREPRKGEYLTTHTQCCGIRCLLIWKIWGPHTFGYGFIYTVSRLKWTLIDPSYVDLYEAHLELTQISNNKPKTKKKIIKIQN